MLDLPADVVPSTWKKTKLKREEGDAKKGEEEEEEEKPKAEAVGKD